jgi:4-amino-4-deoxy-L-arabinose transferase-like glycosyltransferase
MSRPVVLGLLILGGLAIRLPGIDETIVRFHPTRHYRSAVLARACYYDHARDVPVWAKAVADANRVMQPAGEPQVMETLACGAYLAIGRENVVIPRALAAVIWVAGAIPLWMIAVRIASPHAAAIAAAIYLFLPYGIAASRNFQPDPLMTLASLWAIVALLRYHDQPQRSRFVVAALLVGIAGLIKPMSVFITVPVIAVAAMTRKDRGRAIVRFLALSTAGLILPAIYYGYGAVAGSLVRDQMRMRFEPHLIPTAFFWQGLARMIGRVETMPLLALSAIAVFTAADRLGRRLLAALFIGYAAFAVAFTYHMPTHDYYHLPYIALVALGTAALIDHFAKRVKTIAVYTICGVIAVAGSAAAWPRLHETNAAGLARMYEEIGALTEHDTRALFLDTEYGYALMYHGQISGDSWPNQDDLAAEAIDGRPVVDADTRFARDYAGWDPHYFVITDLGSLRASPDLRAMLDRRANPIRITGEYRVYRFNR